MLILLTTSLARAGDVELYERALDLVDERYLWRAQIDHAAMFRSAGESLAERIDWLLVDPDAAGLRLRTGRGTWERRVPFTGDLPRALGELEDAVREAGLPVDPEVDPRVEILRGVADTLDRHTVFLAARSLERFDERLNGTLTGIGVVISGRDGGLTVTEVYRHGPADLAGVLPGDRILRIGGVSTVGMRPADATDRIRGPAGSDVLVLIQRGDQQLEVTLTRRELSIPNVKASVGPDGVGVVAIDHFSEQTTEWLQESLDELADKGALRSGVALDLRDNTGGSLIQSARAADAFIQHGRLVTTSGRDGQRVPGLIHQVDAKADYPPYAMPVAVLMNASTASGSEILAGALAQLDRAILVGDTSFGKGTVQSLYPLADGIKLKLTVAEWILAGDRHVAGVGLEPDVLVRGWRFGPEGAWYPASRGETPAWEVVGIDEEAGWRQGSAPAPTDTPLELAAAITRASAGGTRVDLLDAAARVVPPLAAAQQKRLFDTLAAGGINWTPSPAPPPPPQVDVSLELGAPAKPGEPVEVRAIVHNRGAALYRTAIRLRATDPLWDDVVLPIGRIDPGGTGLGLARVTPRAGTAGRADEVVASLEIEGRAPIDVARQVLQTVGGDAPPVVADVHLEGEGAATVLVAEVTNRGDVALPALTLRLDYPTLDGVTLDTDEDPTFALGPHRTQEVRFGLDVDAVVAPTTLPMSLVATDVSFGTVARFDVDLPRAGGERHVEAPVLIVKDAPLSTSRSDVALHIRATDDTAIDHVSVYAGLEWMDRTRREPAVKWERRKVAWAGGSGRKLDTTVTVPIVEGANHIRVITEDRTGLRTTQDVWVWGLPPAAATVDSAP